MSDVTRILSKIESGDQQATAELLPLVYDELRKLAAHKMAQEKPDHTLQATALVHEAYLRLVGGQQLHWDSRGHFFAAAAEAMRRILLNHARGKKAVKRGGDWSRLSLDAISIPGETTHEELVALNEAVDQLAQHNGQIAEVVNLRIYAGLTIPQISDVMNLGRRTVDRHWDFAKSWLRTRLEA